MSPEHEPAEITEIFITRNAKPPVDEPAPRPPALYSSATPAPPPTNANLPSSRAQPVENTSQKARMQRINLWTGGHTTMQLSSTTTTADLCKVIAARRGIHTQLALLVEASAGPRWLDEDAVVLEVGPI